MSANQPTSFRFPFNLTGKIHEEADAAIRYAFSGLKDLNDAVRALNGKVTANTTAIATQASGTVTSVATTVITGTTGTHSESLTDGNSNFIFANGDIVTVVGVLN